MKAAAGLLTVLVIASSAPDSTIYAWESIEDSGEVSSESEAADYAGTASSDGDEGNGIDSRIEQEKEYLSQALDQLQEWGLSPIAIWSKLTRDDTVLNMIESAAQSVSDAVSSAAEAVTDTVGEAVAGSDASSDAESVTDSVAESVTEAGQSVVSEISGEVTEAVTEAVEEQTEKVKQGVIEQIREWINEALDNL